MSANHSSRQVQAVVRREQATAGSASEVSITMSSANFSSLTRGGRMHETYLIYEPAHAKTRLSDISGRIELRVQR